MLDYNNTLTAESQAPKFIITTFKSRFSKIGVQRELSWADFVKLAALKSRAISIPAAEYDALDDDNKNTFKDCGGFICASLNGGGRKIVNVESVNAITLDVDSLPPDTDFSGDKIRAALPGVSYLLYSTISHRPAKPRFRVVIPLSEPCTDLKAWEAAARKTAEALGVIDYTDAASYRPAQLMYWQRTPSDIEPVYSCATGNPLRLSDILNLYEDWTRADSWPCKAGETATRERAAVGGKSNPLESKNDIIAAFCRRYYPIGDGIEELLSDVYTHSHGNVYDYNNGHGSGGVLTYPHKDTDGDVFLISWHATDPASYNGCDPANPNERWHIYNIFDLVRLHLCGGDYQRAIRFAEWLLLTQ